MEIREFLDDQGRSPFGLWFERLDPMSAVKITTAITRMSLGNFSNAKGIGEGVLEYRIDYGPGYRIYFGKDGDRLVILVAGGTKKRQQADIKTAQARWAEYRKRKAG
jgi:putative addiction module killer protein